jgi:hypothetical protein
MKGTAMNGNKRTGLLIGASILAVVGVIAAAAGVTGIVADQWKRDANGYFSSNAHVFHSTSRAIASEKVAIGDYVPTWLAGNVRLGVSSEKPVFVGIAPKKTVDRYLAGVNHDEATRLDLDPFRVTYVHHAGTKAPGRPADQVFWAASSTGKPLTWKMRSGNWSVVVMNADGSSGVSASIDAGVKVPALLWAGIGLTAGGLLLLAASGGMLVSRSRSQRRTSTATAVVAG